MGRSYTYYNDPNFYQRKLRGVTRALQDFQQIRERKWAQRDAAEEERLQQIKRLLAVSGAKLDDLHVQQLMSSLTPENKEMMKNFSKLDVVRNAQQNAELDRMKVESEMQRLQGMDSFTAALDSMGPMTDPNSTTDPELYRQVLMDKIPPHMALQKKLMELPRPPFQPMNPMDPRAGLTPKARTGAYKGADRLGPEATKAFDIETGQRVSKVQEEKFKRTDAQQGLTETQLGISQQRADTQSDKEKRQGQGGGKKPKKTIIRALPSTLVTAVNDAFGSGSESEPKKNHILAEMQKMLASGWSRTDATNYWLQEIAKGAPGE